MSVTSAESEWLSALSLLVERLQRAVHLLYDATPDALERNEAFSGLFTPAAALQEISSVFLARFITRRRRGRVRHLSTSIASASRRRSVRSLSL